MFLPTLLLSLYALCCKAQLRTHKCVHHHLHIELPNENTRSVQLYGNEAEPKEMKETTDEQAPLKSTSRRRLTKSNIRIHTEFSSALAASTAPLDVNIRAWTEQAVTYWQSALKVEPVSTLSFSLTCKSLIDGPWDDGSTATQCVEYVATEQCNAGETIPSAWLKGGRKCTSCYASSPSSCTGCTDIAAGAGLANKDYAILVTAENTATCQASTSTLGYASPCKYDQFDRPILGHINYCPLAMATASSNIAVAAGKHELAHALGFTSGTFAYFRDPTTSPLAPRTTRDAAGTPPSSAKVCADGNTRTVVTPNINTLIGPMTVRDFPHAYKISTPNVVKAAKEHFNCATQDGMELENQPTSAAASCWGSHWEQRALHTELMTPVTDESSVVSTFTLGFFEDTGWYEADYTKAEPLPWGKNKGCNFLSDSCNTGTKSSPTMMLQNEGYFCNEAYVSGAQSTATMTGCSHNGNFKSYCSLSTYSAALPSAFQHFLNNKNGGALAELDYCPIYAGFSNGDCSDTTHQSANNINYYGDLYGSTSKCLRGTMIHTGYTLPSKELSTCAAVVCSADKSSATLTLKDSSGGSQAVTCLAAEKGTGKTLTNFLGQVLCPDLEVYCPTTTTTFVSWYKNQTIVPGTSGSPTGSPNGDPTTPPSTAPAPSSPSKDDGLGKENLPAKGDAVMASVSFVIMYCSILAVWVVGMV